MISRQLSHFTQSPSGIFTFLSVLISLLFLNQAIYPPSHFLQTHMHPVRTNERPGPGTSFISHIPSRPSASRHPVYGSGVSLFRCGRYTGAWDESQRFARENFLSS